MLNSEPRLSGNVEKWNDSGQSTSLTFPCRSWTSNRRINGQPGHRWQGSRLNAVLIQAGRYQQILQIEETLRCWRPERPYMTVAVGRLWP